MMRAGLITARNPNYCWTIQTYKSIIKQKYLKRHKQNYNFNQIEFEYFAHMNYKFRMYKNSPERTNQESFEMEFRISYFV